MDTEVISVEEFQRRVLANIKQADREARQLFKELTKVPVKPKPRKPRQRLTERQIAYRTHTCKACGCDWDDYNPSCHSCYVRHRERSKAQAKKALV